MEYPLVSIIVTTRNEEEVLGRLLKSIKGQSYQNIEMIVVDNNSDDNTKKVAQGYTKKIFDFGPERSAQRNYGAKKAKGEYLLFLDADMEISRKVTKECVGVTEKEKEIGAAVIPEESAAKNFWEKVKAFERSFYNVKGDVITDAARFFRTSAFRKLGGYDETITGPEDWDLSERVKKAEYKVGRVKAKIYHHERIPSLLALAKKKYYYGLKAHRYLRKQKISPVSAKTIYFLRPVFYRNWRKFLSYPLLTLGMFLMFTMELVAGGTGYIIGRIKKL